MEVRLKPLDGKYYGTIIQFDPEPDAAEMSESDWSYCDEIKLWCRGDWDDGTAEPSDRELAHVGENREQYQRLRDEDADSTAVDICGGHYETVLTLRVAQTIVDGLSKIK